MIKKASEVDVINDILERCILAYPISSFIISLYKQYTQRGSLSKAQLLGLHGKASKVLDMPVGKLATLEAVIKKMPTRFKSDLPELKPMIEKDESIASDIASVLARYPQHKRVLFLKMKFDNNEVISPAEADELKKFKNLVK